MGEARRRGSFEERIELAKDRILREKIIHDMQSIKVDIKPRRTGKSTMLLASLIMSNGFIK